MTVTVTKGMLGVGLASLLIAALQLAHHGAWAWAWTGSTPARARTRAPTVWMQRGERMRVGSSAAPVDMEMETAVALAEEVSAAVRAWGEEYSKRTLLEQVREPFDPSQLPKEVVDNVNASDFETKLAAYSRILTHSASFKQFESLSEAKVAKRSAKVLGAVVEEGQASPAPEQIIQANVAAVKAVRENLPKAKLDITTMTEIGGWVMWLITYMQNRGATADAWVSRSIMAAAAARQEMEMEAADEEDDNEEESFLAAIAARRRTPQEEKEAEEAAARALAKEAEEMEVDRENLGPLLVDEEAVGQYLGLRSDEERQDERHKLASAMYNRAITEELLPDRGIAPGATYEEWLEIRQAVNSRLRELYSEIKPLTSDAQVWVRERGRACTSQLLFRASHILASEYKYFKDPETESLVMKEKMIGRDMLRAAVSLARTCLDLIVTLSGTKERISQMEYDKLARQHFLAVESGLSEGTTLFGEFVAAYVEDAMNGVRNLKTTAKYDVLLLRRLVAMTTGLARVTGNRYYGKQLGLCMASTVKTGSPPKDRYASVMKDLNEIFEVFEYNDIYNAAATAYVKEMHQEDGSEFKPSETDDWVCSTLGLQPAQLKEALENENMRQFSNSLDGRLRESGGNRDWIYDAMGPSKVQELAKLAQSLGLSKEAAAEVVQGRLREMLVSLLIMSSNCWRSKRRVDAQECVTKAVDVLEGVATQLTRAFEGSAPEAEELAAKLCTQGKYTDEVELNASEAAFKMVDSGDAAKARAGNIVLLLMGLR